MRSTSRNTLWSEEADTGGVDGVLGDVGADTVGFRGVRVVRARRRLQSTGLLLQS